MDTDEHGSVLSRKSSLTAKDFPQIVFNRRDAEFAEKSCCCFLCGLCVSAVRFSVAAGLIRVHLCSSVASFCAPAPPFAGGRIFYYSCNDSGTISECGEIRSAQSLMARSRQMNETVRRAQQ